ncbi:MULTISPECIES: aquaporin Z [unclassified Nostoc]|uniref:aquaporin Z n=1 Tax=unclassified Nostoc TaxID=2593658 RepID=UPI0025AAB692|nr:MULTISPECIES: aquaporin Z [unclassified Nostoc]MDM9581476.1 aquaporin Z [Nostoc sp. GT001]MDZ7948350.1 aquaporin Z [Nostoc sp. EfeVER01]MDZ7995327.1 aquaporin Z [Nostoc sp. EspVER01]
MSLTKRCLAEFIGTFWLVLGGCGSAVLAAAYTADAAKISENTSFPLGIGLVGVSLAFGLTVLTGAYAFGHISGGHFNPAVSFGLWAGKRFPGSDLLPYIASQVIGAVVGAGIIYLIASGKTGFALSGSNPLATNGYGTHSPGGYTLFACFISEVVMTFMFLLIILGVTDSRAPKGFAPLAIGFGLTLIHLISIPVTNTSVNPARSTGVALFAGVELFSQVWLFWIAPILGAILAGWLYAAVFSESTVDERQNVKELV